MTSVGHLVLTCPLLNPYLVLIDLYVLYFVLTFMDEMVFSSLDQDFPLFL